MSEQMISALPDVTRTKLIPGADEFLVIACDGIWNSMTSQAVVDFVYDRLHPDPDGDGEAIGTCGSKHGGSGEESDLRSSPAFLEKISEEVSFLPLDELFRHRLHCFTVWNPSPNRVLSSAGIDPAAQKGELRRQSLQTLC